MRILFFLFLVSNPSANAETLAGAGTSAPPSPATSVQDPACHMPAPESLGPDDAPGSCRVKNGTATEKDSFAETIKGWDSVEDLNAWIGANFEYDRRRMKLFGQDVPQALRPSVYEPDQLLEKKSAVCFDLSRFAFEALKGMPLQEPVQDAKYVMIKFEPKNIDGAVIGKHWMVSYKRDGKFYFTADSRCPGRVYGPYDSVEKFQACYAGFRGRDIQSLELRDTYRPTRKQLRRKSAP